MVFVEFLEFIGRVAAFKYNKLKDGMSLDKQIELVLDDILPLVGYQRKDPNIAILLESESDE